MDLHGFASGMELASRNEAYISAAIVNCWSTPVLGLAAARMAGRNECTPKLTLPLPC